RCVRLDSSRASIPQETFLGRAPGWRRPRRAFFLVRTSIPYPTEEILTATWARCRPLRRSEEHTSELQSRGHLVCRLLLEKKNVPSCRRLWVQLLLVGEHDHLFHYAATRRS